MNHAIKADKKLRLSLEPAFQIMFISAISICFSLAFIFATTIQQFNWYTLSLVSVGLILTYFKHTTYVKLFDKTILCHYFGGLKKRHLDISKINELTLYETNRKVHFKMNDEEDQVIYLTQSNQKGLVDWLKLSGVLIDIKKEKTI